MNQIELLETIKKYNSTDKQIIKNNLKRVMQLYNIKSRDIINLGYSTNNVYSWTTKSSPNAPLFDQALSIAVSFSFDVKEFLEY